MQRHIGQFLRHLQIERGASPYTLKSYREDLTAFAEYYSEADGSCPEPAAITDAYALAKLAVRLDPSVGRRLRLVVNRTTDPYEGARVRRALLEMTRRFLGAELEGLGEIPEDPGVGRAARRRQAFALLEPSSPASRVLSDLAVGLRRALGGGRQP